MEWVRQNFAHLAALAPVAFGVLTLIGLAAAWRLGREGSLLFPRTARGRVASLLSISLLGSGAVGLVLSYGPVAPLVETSTRLRRGVGEQVPDFAFRRIADDSLHTISELRGQVLVINLWATWCPPCRTEFPTLNRLQTAYAHRGVVVVTLTDEPREAAQPFVQEHAPAALNGYVGSFGWLDIESFRPFTLIVDRKGVLRDYFFGSQEYDTFVARVREYL
jgi:thiol-disulfide isomerase/thioredoxin